MSKMKFNPKRSGKKAAMLKMLKKHVRDKTLVLSHDPVLLREWWQMVRDDRSSRFLRWQMLKRKN